MTVERVRWHTVFSNETISLDSVPLEERELVPTKSMRSRPDKYIGILNLFRSPIYLIDDIGSESFYTIFEV